MIIIIILLLMNNTSTRTHHTSLTAWNQYKVKLCESDPTCFLGAVQNWCDFVPIGSITVGSWGGGSDTQGAIVGLHTTQVSCGCASAVWHLLVNIVCLQGPNIFTHINVNIYHLRHLAMFLSSDYIYMRWPSTCTLKSYTQYTWV